MEELRETREGFLAAGVLGELKVLISGATVQNLSKTLRTCSEAPTSSLKINF